MDDTPEQVSPRSFPFFAGPTMGELQDLLEASLSNIIWEEGLDQLPSISKSLASIATSLEKIASALEPVTIKKLIEVPDPQNPKGFIQVNAITPSDRGASTGKIDL